MGGKPFYKMIIGCFALACLSLHAQETDGLADEAEQDAYDETIEELLVTGSYIRGLTQENLASPLLTISREEMTRTGAFQISDLINTLTINTGSENNPDAFTQNFTTGTSNINLRGLGVASTLILLNGRRQTFSAFATDTGENFVDTSSLVPMIAVDRIEILKDGATSLYGSDAVAGVANFHTRKNFVGSEFNIEYQSGTGSLQDTGLSGIIGIGEDRTHFMAAFSILDRNGLGTDEKRLSNAGINGDDVSRAGNPGTFLLPVPPTNALNTTWSTFFDADGAIPNVADFFEPLLGAPSVTNAQQPAFADPDCVNIANSDNTTLPPGTFPLGSCQFDFGSFYSLTADEERSQIYTALNHDFSDTLTLDFEIGYADNEASRRNSPSFPITSTPIICGDPANPTTAALDAALNLPARFGGAGCATLGAISDSGRGHPDNPYGSTVLFVGRTLGSGMPAGLSQHDSSTQRIMLALGGALGSAWDWEASLTQSKNEFVLQVDDTLKTEFQRALLGLGGSDCVGQVGVDILPGVGPCGYYNPFGSSLTGSGTENTAQILDYITGRVVVEATAELRTLEAYASGEIMQMSNGALSLAFGIQSRSEELDYQYDEQSNAENYIFSVGNPDFAADRDILAAFAELAIPLTEDLNMQLALRNEDYDGEFSSTDPKFALLWQPHNNLSLRGSYGSSFRAPSLFQQNGTRTALDEIGLVGQFLAVRSQPNPADRLMPEEANIFNIGTTWVSDSQALTLSADFWSFDYENVIIQQDANAVVNAAFVSGDAQALSQIVFINDIVSPTNIERINVYYDNASTLKTDGIDLKLGYEWPDTASGNYQMGLEVTKVMSYDLNDPQLGPIDGLGSRNFNNFATSVPELRSTLSFGWNKNLKHGFNAFIRHIGSYDDDQNPDIGIGAHTTLDLQYHYIFDALAGMDEGIALSVGGINITDEDPPHVATNGGYDSKVHDPRGAVYYVKASIPF